jgi:hypothetical protein
MAMKKATIGTLLAVATISVVMSAFGALTTTQKMTSTGSISAIGVSIYSDNACTIPLTSISWGTLNPGSSINYTIYLKNTGNIPVTLSMTTSNWNPSSASGYMTVTWNRGGYGLAAGTVVQAVLTLTVSSSITNITSFSVDITITAAQ